MAHLFVADTNLFFECHRLEDIAWADLELDDIVIGLVRPVLGEIDKHKKAGGRTRKRAVEMSGRLREMLAARNQDALIRKADPGVVLRFLSLVKPAQKFVDDLDYSINDHQIIGIVASLIDEGVYTSVSLLTDDAIAASTAHALGLPVRLIPETWKRPPEETIETKKIRDLEKDLATYRAQEPVIRLGLNDDHAVPTELVRQVAIPLAPAEIETLLGRLKERHPETTDFTAPEAQTLPDGTEISFTPPDPEAVQKYASQNYPGWIASCRGILNSLHRGRSDADQRLSLSFALENTGTRPATKMRITFEARGNIQICRGCSVPDEEHEQSADSTGSATLSRSLPAPPRAPTPTRHVKKPLESEAAQASPDAILRAASLSSFQGGALAEAIRTLDPKWHLRHLVGPNLARILDDDTMAVLRNSNLWQDKLDLPSNISSISFRPEFYNGPVLSDLIRSEEHNPEAFHFDDWPKSDPVKIGSLTCDLFRHLRAVPLNDIDVIFPPEGDVRAAVRCKVEAENLSKPVEYTISVSRTIEYFSLYPLALEMVEKCGG